MDKKTFSLKDNISQSGGSFYKQCKICQVLQYKTEVQLRGNDKVTVLIDGKQTALTGFKPNWFR
jgi:hypothetical protein